MDTYLGEGKHLFFYYCYYFHTSCSPWLQASFMSSTGSLRDIRESWSSWSWISPALKVELKHDEAWDGTWRSSVWTVLCFLMTLWLVQSSFMSSTISLRVIMRVDSWNSPAIKLVLEHSNSAWRGLMLDLTVRVTGLCCAFWCPPDWGEWLDQRAYRIFLMDAIWTEQICGHEKGPSELKRYKKTFELSSVC